MVYSVIPNLNPWFICSFERVPIWIVPVCGHRGHKCLLEFCFPSSVHIHTQRLCSAVRTILNAFVILVFICSVCCLHCFVVSMRFITTFLKWTPSVCIHTSWCFILFLSFPFYSMQIFFFSIILLIYFNSISLLMFSSYCIPMTSTANI